MKSETISGYIFERFIIPDRWDIKIRKVEEKIGEGMKAIWYELEYTECVKRPENMPRDVFEKAVKMTVDVVIKYLSRLGVSVPFKVNWGKKDEDEYYISFNLKAPLTSVASVLAGEFLILSPLGKMRVMELFILASMGILVLPELLPKPERGGESA